MGVNGKNNNLADPVKLINIDSMALEKLEKLKQIKDEARDFIEEKSPHWQDYERKPVHHQIAYFCVLVVKNFIRNRCLARASALAYTTLLSLVPLLAVAIGVTTSLLQKEGEQPIREMVDKLVAYVAPALDLEIKQEVYGFSGKRAEVVAKLTEFISNIHSGALGATGVIALIFIAVSMLRTIESTFNDIWGVPKGRGAVRALVNYWTVITLGPLIIVLAIGLTSSRYLTVTKEFLDMLGWVGKAVVFILPFVILSFAFGLFYQLMPNTRVQWRAALVGGIVGGCLWEFNSLCNTLYVNRVVTYSKIYGSLGIIPVFLVGLYFSWVILLLGAQVAYVYQNRIAYICEKLTESVNQYGREFVALRIMAFISRAFEFGYGAQTLTAITNALGVPAKLALQTLNVLTNAGLVAVVAGNETAYLPAKPLERITAFDVLDAVRSSNGKEIETKNDIIKEFTREHYSKIIDAQKQVACKITMKDFATYSPAER